MAAPTGKTINGWPLLSGYGDRDLVVIEVPGTKRKLTLHKDVAPLLAHFVSRYDKMIRRIDKPSDIFDDWSYSAPRKGRASSVWSDHSSGTAVDINAAREGAQGPRNYKWWTKRSKRLRTFGQKRYKIMQKLLANHEVFMWGGSTELGGQYTQPKNWDWMHVAVRPGVTPAEVRAVTKRKRIGPDGRKLKKAK